MQIKNRLITLIFFSNLINFYFAKTAFPNAKNTYSIISDTQSQSADGKFEASGNVVIRDQNEFNAKSDKMIFEKDKSIIKLIGNVEIDNYQYKDILIEKIESDEFILFTEKGGFQINSKNNNRVKSKLSF